MKGGCGFKLEIIPTLLDTMKTIKVKFVGFWEDLTDFSYLDIYRILSKYYNIEICDNADYVVCSCFSAPYEFCMWPQVRIMLSEENFVPDFNLIDYSISPYPISFLDRNYTLPVCIKPLCKPDYDHAQKLEKRTRSYPKEFLKTKAYFADFIYSHESENAIRGTLFRMLSEYRRVESPGKYLNNMEDGTQVSFWDGSKSNFQRKCKFSLCVESTKHEGFVTEKITDAFFADSVPIYYGSNTVSSIFNPKAFINCNDFANLEEAVAYVKKVDQDDTLYLQMLNEPVFCEIDFPTHVLEGYEAYLRYIFDQPVEQAYRRSRIYSAKKYENYILDLKQGRGLSVKTMLRATAEKICTKCHLSRR